MTHDLSKKLEKKKGIEIVIVNPQRESETVPVAQALQVNYFWGITEGFKNLLVQNV